MYCSIISAKKSQKTPKREIARAKAERNDYIRQKEAKQ